ncbi:MAG TPA: hypothetical protein VGF48_08240 [Thermoanaerobaculia bacterium]|jgi:tetratricopeptide (TPR) repeat protein
MTADWHPEEGELFGWLDGGGDPTSAMAAHVERCADCANTTEALRDLISLLRDADVHTQAARPAGKPRPERIAAARAAARQIDAEDAEAARTLNTLQDRPLPEWSDALDAAPHLKTEGLVRALIAAARHQYDRNPNYALHLLLLAGGIADHLDGAQAAGEQRWAVAKERANALRMLGRYTEALEALDFGEQFLVHLPVHAFQLALTEWSRATILFYMTRYAEALPLVRRAIRVLRNFGDRALVQQARLLEAGILYEQGDAARALATYEGLASYFAETEDRATLARVWANIAACEVQLDRPDDALAHAADAIRLYDQLDMPSERSRVQWTLGHQLLRQRQFDLALERLQAAAESFRHLGMDADASEVLLDIVELHVTRGAWEEAIAIARALTATFLRLNSPVHTARAYAYLREAVDARRATEHLVGYVRAYVKADDPSLPFEPPVA